MFADVLAVMSFFFLRIGIPLLVLIVVGTLVERGYKARDERKKQLSTK
jgi:hypothetical protein